jgi:hypothetical protein
MVTVIALIATPPRVRESAVRDQQQIRVLQRRRDQLGVGRRVAHVAHQPVPVAPCHVRVRPTGAVQPDPPGGLLDQPGRGTGEQAAPLVEHHHGLADGSDVLGLVGREDDRPALADPRDDLPEA